MASLTEIIESYINDLFTEEEEKEKDKDKDYVSLRRKELAEFFGCVPSQINYVLRSRFTPERGYLVESQRGGHGYIRILKVGYDMPQDKIDHIEALIGGSIEEQEAKNLLAAFQERDIITSRERLLAEVSIRFVDELGSSVFNISPYKRNVLQATLLKRVLRSLVLS